MSKEKTYSSLEDFAKEWKEKNPTAKSKGKSKGKSNGESKQIMDLTKKVMVIGGSDTS